ncbi:RNA 2',3'-cyclic phosphodiesterase [Motiliproteus sp. SC1-56]|uniref:RNA 2',3'-cyclic phosphodiesterase n=1 Tax=Motiliproteus sp. SC1-56 TaxID=2799565 RepID=UPI001A8D15B3|nr:RNA 2',3'-cyclic phosphodiesterase [Motiliproteus sp. SC1-56]
MRLFTAIELPPAMQQALAQLCFGLPRVRWVPEEQLHLTLVFIGEVNPACLEEIQENLTQVAIAPFRLECGGIGSFRSGVLWLGVDKSPPLLSLEAEIRRQLRSINGIAISSRRYKPHITLGRLDRQQPPRLDSFLEQHQHNRYSFEVDHFVLKVSQLSPKGARHRVLNHFGAPAPSSRPSPRPAAGR